MSNLLPPQEIRRIKLLYKKRLVVVGLHSIAVLAIIALVALVPSYIYSKQQEESLAAKKAMFEKRETGELKQSLIATIADINTRLGSFDGVSSVSPIVASSLDPILKARSSSVYITGISYMTSPKSGAGHISISGVANDRESVLVFANTLRKTPGVTAVDVPITNFIKESNLPFGITLTVTLR